VQSRFFPALSKSPVHILGTKNMSLLVLLYRITDYLFAFNSAQIISEKECERAGRTIRRWRKVIAFFGGAWRQ